MIPGQVGADPSGTTVVHGDVTIHKQGTHTEFRQTTGTAILTHESFDIRVDESVHFDQPTTRSLVVNRVIGKDLPTDISGKLTATGNVWVINPSGIAISRGAEVNVNGLIATSADISNEDILSGNRTFAGAPDGSKIINEGTIRGGDGSIVLVAPTVENTGTITTNGSDVALGAGSGFTVDMDGDGLTRFEVTPASGVKITANGEIKADGGAVYMSAESKDTVRDAIVSVGGKVEATRIENKGGEIVISANKGTAEVTGTLDTSQRRGRGGKIIVTGDNVVITRTARLDASGATDGGTVHVGGAFRGDALTSPVVRSYNAPADAPLPTARIAVVERGAQIKVNAGASGDGGEAIVWADRTTVFYGAIEAKGGFLSGDGGLVEVSGKINLAFDGKVDTSAAFGDAGTLLLDPAIVNIVEGPGADDGELDPGPPPDLEVLAGDGGGATFEISDDAIVAALAEGAVTIASSDAINFTGALTFDATGTNTLTFTGAGQINVAGTSITMGDNPLAITSTGSRIEVSTAISTTGASVTLTAREIDITGAGAINVGTGTVTIGQSGNGALTIGGGETGSATQFRFTDAELATITAGQVVIDSNGENITLQSVTSSAFSTFRVESDGGNVDVEGVTTTNTFEIAAGTGGAVDFRSAASSIGTLTIESSASVVDNADIAVTGVADITSTGAVTLNRTGNSFGTEISVNADGVTLVGTSNMNLGAIVSTGALSVSALGATNDITDVGSQISVSGTTSLSAVDDILIDQGQNNHVFGNTVTATSQGIFLTAGANLTLGDITANDATGFGNWIGTNIGNLSLTGDVSIAGLSDLRLFWPTGGTISQTGGGIIADVLNLETPLGAVVALNSATNEINTLTNTVNVAASISFTDTDGVTLGSIATGSLTVTSTDIALTAAITATSVTLINSDADSTEIGVAVAAVGESVWDLTTADLAFLNNAPLTITGVAPGNLNGNVFVRGAITYGGSITLEGSNLVEVAFNVNVGTNAFDITTAGSGNGRINQTAGTVTAGSVTWSAETGITQTAPAAIVATDGTFSVSDAAADILLPGLNNFSPTTFNASGNDITVNDISGIGLGSITATGNLTVTADGTITDTVGSAISVSGTTSLLANDTGTEFSDIVLDNSGVGTHTFGSAVTAAGEDISLSTTGNIDIAGLTVNTAPADNTADAGAGNIAGATGRLTVRSGGSISQSAAVTIPGAASLSATGSVTLDNVANTFGTEISAAGAGITLTGIGDMNLGAIASSGALSVTALGAGGDITDLGNAALDGVGQISVSGTTSLLAADDLILINDGQFFQADHRFGGLVETTSGQVLFSAGGALTVGAVTATAATGVLNEFLASTGGMSLTGTISIGATSDLRLSTGLDAVVQPSGSITADLLILRGNGARTLNQANDVNSLQTAFTGAATSVSITDVDDVDLAGVTVAALTLSTGDVVTDSAATSVTGITSITTTGDAVTLDFATNNFGGPVSVDTTAPVTLPGPASAPAAVEIVDGTGGIARGAIDASTLTVTSNGGSITDTAGSAISVTGTTSLLAENTLMTDQFDIQLDNSDTVTGDIHNFGGAVTATGEDIQIHNVGAFVIGALTATDNSGGTPDLTINNGNNGDLTVRAGGTITQSLALAIPGELDVRAEDFSNAGEFFDIVLITGTNSVGGAFSATGEDISFTNNAATGLSLGNISANAGDGAADNGTNTGDLTLTATAGAITDGATATTVIAPGNTSLSATAGVSVDNIGNDFANSSTAFEVDISGTAIAVRDDAGGIRLGTVSGSSLALTTNNDVTQAGGAQGVVISGNTTINATGGDVTLNGGANNFSTLSGAADSYDIFALTDIFLNGLSADGVGATDITVVSGGSVRNVAGTTTSARGNLTLTANGSFVNTNIGGSSFIADSDGDGAGAVNLTAGLAVISEAGGVISGASVTFNSPGATTIGTTTATNGSVDLNLTTGLISLAGTMTATTGITIDSTTATINVAAGALIDAAGALAVTSASGAISANATSTLEGGTVVLTAGTSATTGIVRSTTGNVTITANGGAFNALGTTTAADDLFITASTNVNVNNVVADNMSLTATGGTITQDAGTTINVTGNSTVTAGAASDIDLTNTGNDFGTVDGAGLNVNIVDIDDIVLGILTVNGNLTVSAGGTVTDAVGERISVTGTTSISATDGIANFFDVVLDNSAPGDVHNFGGLVSISGEDIQLHAVGALDVGGLAPNADGVVDPTLAGADGDLIVRAGGSITQSAAIAVPGDATFLSEDFATAGVFSDILLNSATNSITGIFSAVGEDISISNAGPAGLTLGTITTNDDAVADGTIANGDDGDFTVRSTGGAVIDTTGLAISVAGTTSILADSGADRFDVVLDNVNTHNFSETDPLNVTGEDISIDDIDGILLGSITATDNSAGTVDTTINNGNNGDLTVEAGGDVTQFGGSTIIVPGLATLNSNGGGVTLNETTNDFSDTFFDVGEGVVGTASSFALADANSISFGDITATAGNLTATAPVHVTVATGATARATGDVSFTSTGTGVAAAIGTASIVADSDSSGAGDVLLSAAGNDAGGDFTSTISGANVTITGEEVLGGDIIATNGGASITATTASGVAIAINAGTSLTATTSIDILSAGGIGVGNLQAPTLTATANGGSISQTGGSTWDVSGVSTLSASGSVILAETGNDFGTVNASGMGITLFDTDEIVLDAVTSTGILSVTAEGAIDDATGSISVAGVTSLLATDGGAGFSDIVLDNGLHDFGTDGGDADATTEVDATGANITLTDVDAIKLGAVTANGALTVTAAGSITDTDLEAISVTGATSLTATNTAGTEFFDIRLDGTDADPADRPHNFATVNFLGEGFSIVDLNAITVSGTASSDGTIVDPTLGGDGGATIDAAGEIVLPMLTTSADVVLTTDAGLTLTNLNVGGSLFAAADGDVLVVSLDTMNSVFITTSAALRLDDVEAGGDITTIASGRTRIGRVVSTGGFIDLYTDDYFSIMPGNTTPLEGAGNVFLEAPSGGFIIDGEVQAPGAAQTQLNAIPEGLTFVSASGLLEFDFNVGFQVVDVPGNGGVVLTLDAPVAVIRINEGLFSIGTAEFLDEVRTAGFNPFQVTAVPGDPDLLLVTGEFGLMSDVQFEVRLQNTSPTLGSQNGSGTVVNNVTHLGGAFPGLSLFGSFNGSTSANAALDGFRFIGGRGAVASNLEARFGRDYPAFVENPENTANGCVIGALSSCTPLGSLAPFLDFEDGRLLSIKFVDPTEDEDDPFSNRGDEEEWE